MENILEHYESDAESSISSFNKSQETKEEGASVYRSNSGESDDIDDKEYQNAAKAIEDNLLNLNSDSEAGGINSSGNINDNGSGNDENSGVKSKQEPVQNERKSSISFSFDEDIILPEPRRDLEQEQKERDRQKRKEMKSKRELEEEEREKMQ